LWEDEHLLQAEVLARLTALGLDTGTAAPAALPAAKHIFTHIEWLMSGVQLRVAAQSAPAGYVWASREQLRTAYALPGAFRAYNAAAAVILAICCNEPRQNRHTAQTAPRSTFGA